MITLYDYLPSQNAYKVRLLLSHLDRPYRTQIVSIFEGEGQRPEFIKLNPMGAVPVLQLEDGRAIAESNAILCFLAERTPYLPDDPFERAKVMQWLFFERSYVSPSIATLRYWTLTGKLERQQGVEGRRALGAKILKVMAGSFPSAPSWPATPTPSRTSPTSPTATWRATRPSILPPMPTSRPGSSASGPSPASWPRPIPIPSTLTPCAICPK